MESRRKGLFDNYDLREMRKLIRGYVKVFQKNREHQLEDVLDRWAFTDDQYSVF